MVYTGQSSHSSRTKYCSPTTQFDRLCKRALKVLYPNGCDQNWFKAPPGAACYMRAVKPDFVLPDGRWIDFKLRLSYRDREHVSWQPPTLYASLRKYIDHVNNPTGGLIIVYKHLHGSLSDIHFPIRRGRSILICDAADFQQKVDLVPIQKLYARLEKAGSAWIVDAFERLE